MRDVVRAVLSALNGHSLTSILGVLLTDSYFAQSPTRQLFIQEWHDLLIFSQELPELLEETTSFCVNVHTRILTSEITSLAAKENGWHFSAKNARAEQIEAFSLAEMSRTLETKAPHTWLLLGALLQSDQARLRKRMRSLGMESMDLAPDPVPVDPTVDDIGGPGFDDEDEEGYWEVFKDVPNDILTADQSNAPRPKKRQRRAGERLIALGRIRRVVLMSILLQSTNQKCNAFAATIGLFLHSTSTPELVIEVFAHAGLSISLSAIHTMIDSLSTTSGERLQELMKTYVACFAWDNFDIDLRSWLPTVERPGTTLQHGTSALAFPLAHGVTSEHLKCAAELWATDPLNPNIPPSQHRPKRTWVDCLPRPIPNYTTVSEVPSFYRILAWHFRRVLVEHCAEFKHFRKQLGAPETMMQIPVEKTTHIPCRAMDINSSTADGQAQIAESLFSQSNLGDPTDTPGVVDIREHVVLVHGDLGTGERLQSVKESRAIETKPVRRLEMVIFIPGLFHLLMACADAIWKMYFEPQDLRATDDGLFRQSCKIRPNESGRLGSKPGFRLMHDLIHHHGTARMLDVWQNDLKKRTSHNSFAEYAASKPTWDEVTARSLDLVQTYVNKPQHKDGLFRNNSLILLNLLNYIELAHAMKHGDIGRVEGTFLHWIFVFKTVGKHKYATALIKVMNDLKYTYSEELARAIRLNWLCNPTGKADGFRAIDWLVELMNLYIKVIYSGVGYTRTFQLIIKQSPLIDIFRRVHTLMQDNFHLLHRSVRHAPPNLQNTLTVLQHLLEESKAHEVHLGRKAYKLMDHLREGMRMLQQRSGIYVDEQETDISLQESDTGEETLDFDDLDFCGEEIDI
ncbi:hypothetical protein QCA50_018928 [Cerrena zonata]|uniref:DUF6589 domain-containing protein n=1 Tax=Cerrena zonata TaxID=2478898 RepID=A0AAW0FA92_9APHY